MKGNVLLRKRQYTLSDQKDTRTSLGAQILYGKIDNERRLLMRFARNHSEIEPELNKTTRDLKNAAIKLKKFKSEEQLRGVEVLASKLYFGVFDRLILSDDPAFGFQGRNRMPPRDPVNAMLSFAYTLLASDCIHALTCVGLDPYVGFLHRDRPGKPSLALDLMEELRPLEADRLVLRLINLKAISGEMFEENDGGGIYLNFTGKRRFLREWNNEKTQEVFVPSLAQKIPMGLLPHIQARQLVKYIQGEITEYCPVKIR